MQSRDIGADCHGGGPINTVEFSDDGSFFASGGGDGRVLLWPTEKVIEGKSIKTTTEMTTKHESFIHCIAVGPDNGRLFSGGEDDQLLIYDIKT